MANKILTPFSKEVSTFFDKELTPRKWQNQNKAIFFLWSLLFQSKTLEINNSKTIYRANAEL